ncbi:hypothetical protein LCGC14_3080490 [marine sediment metagenome]|uniref:Uncharacterized protein n=1 Tax=marine sediment metagenome TaxID=412755 RepID=A0A0F8WEB1_9ZZZZ
MADTWQVVSQRQTSDITPDGRFIEVMEVVVQLVSGTTITERIPIEQYTPEVVQQRIEARVGDVIEVENL